MRIAILTLPLCTNYGGILQAYALQTFLERLGHEVVIIDTPNRFPEPSLISILKRYVKRYLLKDNIEIWAEKQMFDESVKVIMSRMPLRQFTDSFINKYIHQYTVDYLSNIDSDVFDAIVVGSDQCWRPLYTKNIANYFLCFAKKWNIRRIAYAASFGVDTWEYTNRETRECKKLAGKFNAISVRESSAVKMCQDYFDVSAEHVLDPTMLLYKDDYLSLLRDNNHSVLENSLFCYILDDNESKKVLIKHIVSTLGFQDFYCMPKLKDTDDNIRNNIEDCVFPPVEQWLQSFNDAKMIIVDSFHGAVFSIIFNKPFWIIGNKKRGMARFESLLSMFQLNDRMIDSGNTAQVNWEAPIDWMRVNNRLNELRSKSKFFLQNALA